MSEKPLYAKVVAGYEDNEYGKDAVALAELLARTAGGELEKLHVERGSPAEQLRGLAEMGEADLIVLGSTHRAPIGAVVPGSVAEHLLHGAPARLAIAPRGYAQGSTPPFVRDQLRVIAVGFDGSRESRAALAEATEIARLAGATLRVITVSPPPPPNLGAVATHAGTPPPVADLQGILHDTAAELPAELRALPVHEKGDPVMKLIERAAEGVDLLVLGSRGRGPLLRIFLGSVSARVIREAPCPVMVVPRSAG